MSKPPPRLSTFPLDKPFERAPDTTQFSEIAFRLVLDLYSDQPEVIGTATILSGHLLVTAKHVLENAIQHARPTGPGQAQMNHHLAAIQILPGPQYVIWDIAKAWTSPWSDLALLHLGSNRARSNGSTDHQWRVPRIRPFPPGIGETVAAFGFHSSRVSVSRNAQGGQHIDLQDEPTFSVGKVKEIHEYLRDRHTLKFPCYQVAMRFDGGMSGGPVFDETGCLCGLVCYNLAGSHLTGEPISYVVTLWPIFAILIEAKRAGRPLEKVPYPAIELARGGEIPVPELLQLDVWMNGVNEWYAEHERRLATP